MADFRFKNVLVYLTTPGEDVSAAERALEAVTGPDGAITIATVVPPLPKRFHGAVPDTLLDWREAYVQDMNEALEAVAERLRKAKPDAPSIETAVLSGKNFIELARQALRSNHDVLFKEMKGEDGNEDAALDFKLLRKVPCAVWMTRPQIPIQRIAVAVTPTNPLMDQAEWQGITDFNRRLMAAACGLTEQFKAELHAIQAWEAVGAAWVASRAGYEEYQQLLDQVGAASYEELRLLLKEFGVNPTESTTHCEHGQPEEIIPSLISEHDVNLLVIGNVARSGISGHLLGNTAEKILRRTRCDVLALKPEGWVSPVKLED